MVRRTRRRRGKKRQKESTVSMGKRSVTARNVMVVPFVSMPKLNAFVRNVVVLAFVSMEDKKLSVGIVVGASCAKPHTVLPEKIECIKDTVLLCN